MNNNAFNLGMPRLWLPPKLLLIMKMIIIIMTTCLLQVSAATFAQKFTYAQKDVSYGLIFKEIIKQTGYKILYSDQILDKNKTINVNFKAVELKEVMETLLKNQPLTYEIDGTTILIKEKDPTFLDRVVATLVNIDVSGRVVDTDGRGLPGASVSVKGKGGKAVSTGTNGSFYLKGVEENAVLLISFIGYVPKEVKAAKELGDVVLEISTSKLDEVQVIAYGTTTQRLSTGNVTTIKADVIEKQPVNNPLLALQGRVPGLFIEQSTGFAGTGVKVRVQGQNSLNNGSDPLYVIDGIPFPSQLLPSGNLASVQGRSGDSSFGSPLSFINPSDIESIDVLKDADATAIYGSRAANGAILITTKKGMAGDTRINLNFQSGWANVPRKLDLMNSQQYLGMRREALQNDGIAAPDKGAYVDSDLNGNWDTNRYTDWQKELIGGTATYQDLNSSITGGNDRTVFLVGAGHHRETNVFPGHYADNKTSVRFTINNSSVNQRFKIGFSGSYLFDNNHLPTIDLTSHAMKLAPIAPALYSADGSINWAPDASGNTTFAGNPIGFMFNSYLNKSNNLMSNLNLSYQILPGLEVKSVFGYNKLNSNIIYKSLLQSRPPELVQYTQRSTILTNSDINSWSVEPQLTYKYNISKGKLELLLGTTFSKNASMASGVSASGFSNDLVMDDILSATNLNAFSSTNSTYKYNAVFGRVNYNWQDKYILNLSGRRDGSSRFGPNSQFHNFAAVGGAWVFSNESLIKNHLAFLSFGKVKASYGTTGNDQISDYRFLSLYNPLQQDIPYQGVVAYQPNRLTNPYLEWEETRKIQFGLDLGFINNRILINTNYYINHSSNQLSNYVLPATTGFSTIDRNLTDNIRNSGWDFSLTSLNLQSKNFKWSSSINFTQSKTILNYSPDNRFSSSKKVGNPLSSFLVYHFLGVDPATGVYQFEDHNGNPTTTPDDVLDKTVLIDLAPKFYGGIQNSISYNGFQLDFSLLFVNQIAKNQDFGFDSAPGSGRGVGNQLTSLLKRWRTPGDVSTRQRFTTNRYDVAQAQLRAYDSDAAWVNASYISLKNVSFSWQLPEELTKRLHLQFCSVFVQGQNLWTITSYKGLDPETKSSTTLPPLRVVTLGLKVSL